MRVTEERPLVSLSRRTRVDLIVEVGIQDMDFFGTDADDGTVLLVQLLNSEYILSSQDDIVVKLDPGGESSKKGPGNMGNW